jgi:serine/threonine-protein kinase
MTKEKDRAPPSSDAAAKQGESGARVQTEWARGLIPGKRPNPARWPASEESDLLSEPIAAGRIAGPIGDPLESQTRARPSPGVTPSASHSSDERTPPEKTDSAHDEPLLIGQILGGRYRLERALGEGGMGRVYLARDEQVEGESFAIKVLKAGLRGDALTLLREEVHKTRKLSHPNIVDVHSLNSDGTRLYVLMEYLEGKPLNVLLDEDFGRGMPFRRAWPIIEDVGAALGCAHDHSVIHSDLKPANIFVTTSGRTKLLDFGIARASRGQAVNSGVFALTPAYASCEMLEGREPDARDDIYSFACVIYEMLSGKHPFGNLDALAARDSGAVPAPLACLYRGQNAALAKGLAFEREARTASVEELLAGLSTGKTPARRSAALTAAAVVALLAIAGLGYLALEKAGLLRHPGGGTGGSDTATPTAAAFNPPPHSVAVLPFANLSGDQQQEYFSDGLTEELLNSLTRIDELHVAARTSSFSFKGKNIEIGQIARKLNVAAVLEGSVRRSAHTLRVTAQLIDAVSGYHLWSQTYDRDLGDTLKLQTEIANAVAAAMKVTLLGDIAAQIELGGTRNPAAFDAYLRATKAQAMVHSGADEQAPIDEYTHAIRLDPNYALAFAGRAMSRSVYATSYMGEASPAAHREVFEQAQADARKAIVLAPDLAEGHLALAHSVGYGSQDFARANEEFELAVKLAPGNARVLRNYGTFAASMGRAEAGVAAITRSIALDPLNRSGHGALGQALYRSHQYSKALAPLQDALSLDPGYQLAYGFRGLAYYALRDYQRARATCELKPDVWESQLCLAVTYDKLGRHADAEAMLANLQRSEGENAAYQYAEVYAQWGDEAQALEWLEKALQLHDSGLTDIRLDPLLDPLRKEPRFQAIVRSLNFPA